MADKRIPPLHPGVHLKEMLEELKSSQYKLAKELGVPAMRVSLVITGKRPITAELALRLGRYFGQNPRYWMNLQSRYDMDVAEDAKSKQVARGVCVDRCAHGAISLDRDNSLPEALEIEALIRNA